MPVVLLKPLLYNCLSAFGAGQAQVKILYYVIAVAVLATAVVGILNFWRIYRRDYYSLWVPSYFSGKYDNLGDRALRQGPLHIIFTIADHFEPGNQNEGLQRWIEGY
ncbi:MAG: hypothetical protein LAN59_10355, partial [Acidobacteriia bacterium]|nr:hypothetical protein [Terriglobia bacterium]